MRDSRLFGGATEMRNKVTLFFIAFGILFVVSGSALAHHGAAAYDSSKMVTVTGTVTDFQFVNPHVMIPWT